MPTSTRTPPALSLLPKPVAKVAPVDLATRRAQRWLDTLSRALAPLFPSPRVHALNGLAADIAALLRPISRIELRALTEEAKVALDGGVLYVHPDYPLQLARGRARRSKQRCWLYVAHEVAHLAQGVGDKERVIELHASEGEETILQIDLEADHAAALFVAAVADESLEALKADSLAMLDDFPASRKHAPGAVQRKARRSVAIAVDLRARALGVIVSPETYAYMHWPRGGGVATVFARGAYTKAIATLELGASEVAVLDSAAGGGGNGQAVFDGFKRWWRDPRGPRPRTPRAEAGPRPRRGVGAR